MDGSTRLLQWQKTSVFTEVFCCIELVADTGFEPVKAMPADLQSAPVGRLGNLPKCAAFVHE